MNTVYVNGEFCPEDQACVPVLDRGFIFGDGVYEVIPAYNGKLFRLQQHLERLQTNLDAIRIQNPMTFGQWEDMLYELIDRNRKNSDNNHYSVYLQVTRGVAKRDHALPDNIKPTVVAMANPLLSPSGDDLKTGVKAITADDFRWRNCQIKATSLLANVLLRQMAVDKGATESILIRDDYAYEGAASNIFIVENGCIITPPKSQYLLPGITRDLVLELAAKNNIPHEESTISRTRLQDADEIWMTSSTKEILPITQLDNRPVGKGVPGPIWKKMLDLFQAFKQSYT